VQNLIYPSEKVCSIGDKMAGIVPHKHCIVCGNAIGGDENFCDEVCESKYKSAQKRQQILFVIFVGVMALILILPMILNLTGLK
jgi:predicted nucleic acid-binding Zn ribbon protein